MSCTSSALYSALVGTNLTLSIFLPYTPVNNDPPMVAACSAARRMAAMGVEACCLQRLRSMVNRRIYMRKIRDALVYSFDQRLSSRKVGQIIGTHPSTVCSYLIRFKESGLAWPLSEELDDATDRKSVV